MVIPIFHCIQMQEPTFIHTTLRHTNTLELMYDCQTK